MTWVKLDDQFFRNPKMIEAGKDARALYLAALCHCASGLTDGFVSTKALHLIAADAEVKPSIVHTLERLGLWDETIGGWWVHDYLEYNPTAESVKKIRRARAEAGKKGGEARALASATAKAQANALANPVPPLQPRPVPSRPEPETGQPLSPGSVQNLRVAGGLA